MSFQIYSERPVFSPSRVNLGHFGVVPLVYAVGAGALAAGTVVADWMAKDDWSVGEYNSYMTQMHQTILAWDKIGWTKGCWTDMGRRARWKVFMESFGKHYGAHGQISGYYVSDSEERPARDFMRQLAAWGDELNKVCGANIPSGSGLEPPPKPEPTEPLDYFKYGAWIVGGILALQLVGVFRGATGGYR